MSLADKFMKNISINTRQHLWADIYNRIEWIVLFHQHWISSRRWGLLKKKKGLWARW
jgi:hypothetical protein